MSELTKQQLTVENNSSFPNNNTGFITPTLLRTFNGNIIDSMVDEVTYNADSASWTSDITALEQFSASLNANFVTPTQLSASSSTLQNNINTKLNTASFNAYTASQGSVSTGSLLLTASAVSNVITFTKGDGSTFPVTVGSVIDSSSLVSTASFNTYTQSASTNVSASINAATSSLSASISSSIGSLSASIAVTDLAQSQSIAQLLGFSSSLDTTFATDAQLSASASTLQNDINTRLLTSSFQTYTSSITSQLAGIGQSLAGKLNTSSLSVTQNITGSIIISGSSTGAGGETLRILGGPNPLTDLAIHVLSGSVEITTPQGNGAHFYSNAPITSSNLRINGTAVIKDLFVSGTWGGTGSGSLFVENSITASVISASTIIANSASFQYVQTVFETASVIYSSGSNQFGDASDDTQTLFGKVDIKTGPLVITGSTFVSGNITMVNGTDLITHHIKAPATNGVEIQANGGGVVALFGAGGGLGTSFNGQINATSISASGNITGNLVGNASSATSASFATTASFALNAGASVNTGSLLLTASATDNIITFTKGDGSTFPITVATGSGGSGDRNGLITTGSSALTQNITGSLIVTGNILVVEQFPTINTNNTFFTSTGSTQLDLSIVRAGGGTTDVTNLRLQAISGSTTTDTVQSQLLVGNNNNTATFFSSSASIQLSTVFATGSGGGRVAYSANVSVNSFSGSANVAITAPVVRMGQASANIISTGSWTHNGTFVTSNGITANQGGITATSGSINGEFRVNGSINITGSNPTIQSGSLSGSLVSTLGDIYPSTPQGNFIVTIDSASMATLISGGQTNANTLYFVI